jgi:hypothetical protein
MAGKQTYTVNWRYKSNLGGPWQAGDEVELEPDVAQAIDNDSPGVLTLVEQGPPDKPTADRQVKMAHKRTVERHMPGEPEQPSTQEPIDKTTFKAVRDKS